MATCGQCSGEIVKKDDKYLCQECGLVLYPERVWKLVHQALKLAMENNKNRGVARMAEKFEEGKKYIFRKKLFIEAEQGTSIEYEACKDWVDKLDGQEVESYRCDGYGVAPEWCEEVPNAKI